MVTVIEEKEIMTLRELEEKYADKWFCYVVEGEYNEVYPDDNMCYVVFVTDTEEELYDHPYPEFTQVYGGISHGNSVVFPLEVGGIYSRAKA